MSTLKDPLTPVKMLIEQVHNASALSRALPQLIAVSKRQSEERVRALLHLGHRDFGENQVQEAKARWIPLLKEFPDVRLHLIGALQSNKVADAVSLCHMIHSIDREKIARAVGMECAKQSKTLTCLIQINIGEEPQKSGIAPNQLTDFLDFCRKEARLTITGLMAIPPEGENPAPYFALMYQLMQQHQLSMLSMGMSSDFEVAIRFGATHLRLGTALFGQRLA